MFDFYVAEVGTRKKNVLEIKSEKSSLEAEEKIFVLVQEIEQEISCLKRTYQISVRKVCPDGYLIASSVQEAMGDFYLSINSLYENFLYGGLFYF